MSKIYFYTEKFVIYCVHKVSRHMHTPIHDHYITLTYGPQINIPSKTLFREDNTHPPSLTHTCITAKQLKTKTQLYKKNSPSIILQETSTRLLRLIYEKMTTSIFKDPGDQGLLQNIRYTTRLQTHGNAKRTSLSIILPENLRSQITGNDHAYCRGPWGSLANFTRILTINLKNFHNFQILKFLFVWLRYD